MITNPILTDGKCSRSYVVNHFRTVPVKPNLVDRQTRCVSWSIVSKVTVRSGRTRAVGITFDSDMCFSSEKNNRAVSVGCPAL